MSKEKNEDPKEQELIEINNDKEIKKKFNVWNKLGEIIQEILNCCKE